jgi:hypothetical protein
MSDLKNFLFNSDYPTDKIVYTTTGKIKITSSSPWVVMYDHHNTHINAQLYAEGVYKIEGDDTIYPMVTVSTRQSIMSGAVTFMNWDECYVSACFISFGGLLNKEVTYWMWCYADEKQSKNIDIMPTSTVNKNILSLDSDANYPRFIGDGFIEQGGSYTHGLGYKPYVKAWNKMHYEIEDPEGSGTNITIDGYEITAEAYFGEYTEDNPWVIRVTDTQISAGPTTDPDYYRGYYYRLYAI